MELDDYDPVYRGKGTLQRFCHLHKGTHRWLSQDLKPEQSDSKPGLLTSTLNCYCGGNCKRKILGEVVAEDGKWNYAVAILA